MIEHKTTHARWFEHFRKEKEMPAPKPPKGEGWVFLNGCVNDDYMFWFWEREVEDNPHEGVA